MDERWYAWIPIPSMDLGSGLNTDKDIGLHLSVTVCRPALVERQLKLAVYLEHFTVHTGELVKSVNLEIRPENALRLSKVSGWPSGLEWQGASLTWETPRVSFVRHRLAACRHTLIVHSQGQPSLSSTIYLGPIPLIRPNQQCEPVQVVSSRVSFS